MTEIASRISEYFARDDAAAAWWAIDHTTGGRYGRQLAVLRETVRPGDALALDVATGRGRFAIEMASAGVNVVAVDIAEAMLHSARENARKRGVEGRLRFVHGDATKPGIVAGPFDLITIMEVLVHLSEPEATIARLASLLSPGGRLVLNYDFAHAPKITYPIDRVHGLLRTLRRGRIRSDYVMYDTVEQTLQALKTRDADGRFVMRPRDAYRGLSRKRVRSAVASAGLRIDRTELEYTSLVRWRFPVPIGEMLVCRM